MKRQKDFTVNVDVSILAKNEIEAIQKVSEALKDYRFWLGDISEEKE